MVPWLRDLSATPPTTTTKSTTTTITTTTTTKAYIETEIFEEFDIIGSEDDLDEDEEDEDTIDYDYPEGPIGHCSPITERNLFWNWTRAGQEAIQPCPPGSSGFARWGCDAETGHWSSQYPNLGECRSHWLRRLEADFESRGVGKTSSRLAEFTGASILYGGDLAAAVRLLKRLPEKLAQELPVLQSQRAMEHEASVLQDKLAQVASDLLDQSQLLAWQDLSDDRRSRLASVLMQAVVESSMLAAEVLNREKRTRVNTTNVGADTRVKGARRVEDQFLSDQDNDVFMVASADALAETSVNGAVRLGFFTFDNLDLVLPAPSLDDPRLFLNSRVAGAAVISGGDAGASATGALPPNSPPLIVSLRRRVVGRADVDASSAPICGAWDYASASWDLSSSSCRLLKTTATHTTCECSRLTQYAIISRAAAMEDDSVASPHNYNPEEKEDELSGFLLAGACLLAALAVFSLTLGLLYAKRKTLNLCNKSNNNPSNDAEASYPPLSTVSSSSTSYGKGSSATSDEIARQLQARPPPNVIFNKQTALRSSFAKPPPPPYPEHLIYNQQHIYSEIDPNYARYLLAAAAAAASASSPETSSETFSSSAEGGDSHRDSPVFYHSHHQQTPSTVALLNSQDTPTTHHHHQSSIVSARSLRMPQVPQPQMPSSAVMPAITLQDGDGQLLRLRLEDPYTIEALGRQQQQQQSLLQGQCFQV